MSEFASDIRVTTCPVPYAGDSERITLAYGEGGRLSRRLIRERILTRFRHEQLHALGDAALLPSFVGRMAFTTDSYTVTPLFFPGSDIGQLAVFGTVNDLAVSNAVARWLSLSLIIEDGLEWSVLDRVLDSIQIAASVADVQIVTGDTKVVPRGVIDKLFITTSGIGEVLEPISSGPMSVQPGDVLIVSGSIGRHGAAILCAREQFEFDPPPTSDCVPLTAPIVALHQAKLVPHNIRDATRGGVAAVLFEWAESSQCTYVIEENKIPVCAEVRAVCELLGLDPLHLANEGTFVLTTPAEFVAQTLNVLRQFDVSRDCKVIGHVCPQRSVPVAIIRSSGREVPLNEPLGSPLPRIC